MKMVKWLAWALLIAFIGNLLVYAWRHAAPWAAAREAFFELMGRVAR